MKSCARSAAGFIAFLMAFGWMVVSLVLFCKLFFYESFSWPAIAAHAAIQAVSLISAWAGSVGMLAALKHS